MRKVLNVDEFLQAQTIEVQLKGKTYLVKDIPVEVQDMLAKEPPDYAGAVAAILGIDRSELADCGIITLVKIVQFVHENLVQPTLPGGQLPD
ncbi:MAG: hypothetical protein DRO11_02770 [Methanobacteriota archaeon]|nr:MAG: hypothetical protein DRO11_02770 [Euryarchaeota archaeon]